MSAKCKCADHETEKDCTAFCHCECNADFVKVERWECRIACGRLLTEDEIANHGCELTPDQQANVDLRREVKRLREQLGAAGQRETPGEPSLNAMAAKVAEQNQKWWIGPDGAKLTRNAGELMMLVVTEVAEAFEGERKNLMDDKLPHRRMAEVEIADTIVRLLDYAAARGYDLDGAMREKLEYNAARQDHKKEAAKIAAGNPLEFVSVFDALSVSAGPRENSK